MGNDSSALEAAGLHAVTKPAGSDDHLSIIDSQTAGNLLGISSSSDPDDTDDPAPTDDDDDPDSGSDGDDTPDIVDDDYVPPADSNDDDWTPQSAIEAYFDQFVFYLMMGP